MSYSGYRVKIGGNILPNNMIAKGSYNAVEEERIVETWTDASYVEHQITSGTPKATITFALREHDSSDHASFIAFFSNLSNVSVQYYSDLTNAYRTATCRIVKPSFSHLNTYGGELQYKATNIKIIEN